MNYVDIFLLIIITAGYVNEHKANTVLTGESLNSPNHRNKRSDCIGKWNISSSCMCGDHCWLDSYRTTFSTSCGPNVSLSCCIIRRQNTYQLSSNCPAYDTYLDLECDRTGGSCLDGQAPYRCTCSNGYLSPTPTTPTIPILVGTIIPIVVFGVIVATLYSQRVYKHRKAAELEKKIQAGIIPINRNVMVIVDDLDEFKVNTTRLMGALQDMLPNLVCERLGTWNVLNDNYEIKCDKLLVFRKKSNATETGHMMTALTKKVHFRNNKQRSVVVECGENDVTTKAEVNNFVGEICLVPSMKHIGGWLPVVIRNLFDVKERCITIHNSTYFINSEHRTSNSEYCKELRCTVENLLISFGATVAHSEHAAMCKLAFLDSMDDNLTLTHYFIFVSIGPRSDRNRQYLDKNAFGRKDVILGIFRLLFTLNLISCKGMPNIKPMRYNPMTKEFV